MSMRDIRLANIATEDVQSMLWDLHHDIFERNKYSTRDMILYQVIQEELTIRGVELYDDTSPDGTR